MTDCLGEHLVIETQPESTCVNFLHLSASTCLNVDVGRLPLQNIFGSLLKQVLKLQYSQFRTPAYNFKSMLGKKFLKIWKKHVIPRSHICTSLIHFPQKWLSGFCNINETCPNGACKAILSVKAKDKSIFHPKHDKVQKFDPVGEKKV